MSFVQYFASCKNLLSQYSLHLKFLRDISIFKDLVSDRNQSCTFVENIFKFDNNNIKTEVSSVTGEDFLWKRSNSVLF